MCEMAVDAKDITLAPLSATVGEPFGLVRRPESIVATKVDVVERGTEVLVRGLLVAPDRQQEVSATLDDIVGDGDLATQRVDGDQRPLDEQQVQQLRDRSDLAGLLSDLDLPLHEAIGRAERAHHVDEGTVIAAPQCAASRLAVDRYDVLHGSRGSLHPSDEQRIDSFGLPPSS